jgi:hypothetical protein
LSGNVQDVVQPSVPGPPQPVSDLLTGGDVEGCGAGPGREVVAVGARRGPVLVKLRRRLAPL